MTSVASPLQAVLDVFSGPLHGVRFADIDAEGLSSLAAEVESLANDVAAREAELASLREACAHKQEALWAIAQQALAYARIYAEGDEALSAELNEITLPRSTKPRKSASGKASPTERGSKAQKDETDASANEPEVTSQELAPAPSKARRKTAVANASSKTEPEALESVEEVAPPKGARRKLPTRSGRAR